MQPMQGMHPMQYMMPVQAPAQPQAPAAAPGPAMIKLDPTKVPGGTVKIVGKLDERNFQLVEIFQF